MSKHVREVGHTLLSNHPWWRWRKLVVSMYTLKHLRLARINGDLKERRKIQIQSISYLPKFINLQVISLKIHQFILRLIIAYPRNLVNSFKGKEPENGLFYDYFGLF